MHLVMWFTSKLPSEEQGDGPDDPCGALPTRSTLLFSMIQRKLEAIFVRLNAGSGTSKQFYFKLCNIPI